MYLLGYDIGSSSVKASLVNAESGKCVSSAFFPKTEAEIIAVKPGWAEQDPGNWWENLKLATQAVLAESGVNAEDIKAIGISYQMHGLVCVDKNQQVLRPAIIWCDSRAVPYGQKAFETLGEETCLSHLLNSPGNFTASKLAWIKENEPSVYEKIHKIMLPGDKVSGLKEAIRVLDGVEDIQICRLTPADVVRHVLVQRIVAAYDKYEKSRLPDDRARKFTQKPQTKRNLK